MTGLASTAQADWAPAGGEIGLVDTDTTAAGTQGATLVYPGVNGQSLGDIRLLIPNSFKNGDTIDLAIFDRTATATSNGQINADAAHRLGFTGAPTVTVDKTPYVTGTSVGPTSASGPSNTEGTGADAPDADTASTKATTPPVFTPSVVASSRANGLATDIIRLTVSGVQAAGDPTDEWIVTLSDVKADLGSAVSPGELRVVPFAYNGAPSTSTSNQSPVFAGNVAGDPTLPFAPTINIYTVPAYVAPVTWSVGAPNNVIADGTTQKVGDVTIAETNNYSLEAGTYTITVNGATIQNGTTGDPVTVTKSGGATDETVASPAVTSPTTIQFTITQPTPLAADQSKLSLVLSGLELSAGAQGPITYTLTGGSIDNFLADPAGTSGPSQSPAPDGVPADTAFSAGVNQTDIEAPALVNNSQATALPDRIGGADRYSTAAKIAQQSGSSDWVVLASGEDFPDALSSNYLASSFGTSTLLTKKNSIPAATVNAMRWLGTKTVFVVGGTNAISNAVVDQLRATSQYYPGGTVTIGQGKLQVVRLGGNDRFATNRIINEYAAANTISPNPVGRTQPAFGQPTKLTALVASGETFADALASGPATSGVYTGSGALGGSIPLILTRAGSLSGDAASQFSALGVEHAVIVGGTAAVSDGVKTAIEGAGLSTARIGGADRFETATLLADWETAPAAATPTQTVGGLGFDDTATNNETAFLAQGDKFADALAAGALAGGSGSPILLTKSTSLSPATMAWLTDNAAQYSNVVGLGLGAAISSSTLNAAAEAVSAS